jgi:hypothetical protein
MLQLLNHRPNDHGPFTYFLRLDATSAMATRFISDSYHSHTLYFVAKPTKTSLGNFEAQPPNRRR